jgi:anti-anti-sigma regulatory factor
MVELFVSTQPANQAVAVRVTGSLDGTEVDTESLFEAVRRVAPPWLVVLDLRDLELLTAAGARGLRMVAEELRGRGVRLRVVAGPESAAAGVDRAAGLESIAPVFDNLERALDVDGGEPGTVGGGSGDIEVLAQQFTELTRALVETTTVGGVLQQVVAAALVMVPGADLASVSLADGKGGYTTPAQTDELAGSLDQLQYSTGQGPCVEAARPDGPAYAASTDLATETRWPEFSRRAADRGMGAVLSIDLLLPARTTPLGGALNIYARSAGGLGDTARLTALLLATHASLALAYTTATELADLDAQHLRAAIESRDVIGQAKGILMARQGLTADEAFDLLRRTSQDLNVKLVDLARSLTDPRGWTGRTG